MDRLKPNVWEDDTRMNVLFSPFREKSLNPTSWTQKMKFWIQIIEDEHKLTNKCILERKYLPQMFSRKGKLPCCLDTVLSEMLRYMHVFTYMYYWLLNFFVYKEQAPVYNVYIIMTNKHSHKNMVYSCDSHLFLKNLQFGGFCESIYNFQFHVHAIQGLVHWVIFPISMSNIWSF